MLLLLFLIALYLAFRRHHKGQLDLQVWIRSQLDIAEFKHAGDTTLEDRLRLRAVENRRLTAAFGIDNSLTTDSPATHRRFLNTASHILNRNDRSWKDLYYLAGALISARISAAAQEQQSRRHPHAGGAANNNGRRCRVPLAELVRCVVLGVVLEDSFGLNARLIPWTYLATITREINEQWLRSKREPEAVTRSEVLDLTIRKLGPIPWSAVLPSSLTGVSRNGVGGGGYDRGEEDRPLTPEEILGLLMPQYETLWRVVLLTFVTAFHHQPQAVPDAKRRITDVPDCLGHRELEEEALKLAKEGLRLYPSNKHLYRSSNITTIPPHPAPRTLSTDLLTLHTHPQIWGRDSLQFRPSRFDSLTDLQRAAYIPFSLGPHRCPAGAGAGRGRRFGERMVLMLVAALGRGLDAEQGSVDFGAAGWEMVWRRRGRLPMGRGEVEGWGFEVWG